MSGRALFLSLNLLNKLGVEFLFVCLRVGEGEEETENKMSPRQRGAGV